MKVFSQRKSGNPVVYAIFLNPALQIAPARFGEKAVKYNGT